MSDERTRFTVKIECPKCKQTGIAIWEEAAAPNPHGLEPTLVEIPEGFYQRVRKNLLHVPELVCGLCGAIISD